MSKFWIHTRHGLAFDLLDPQPEQISLADIAYALAGICRYTGHGRITVAEHSVLVAKYVYRRTRDLHLAWQGLMHDAHEAYLGDDSSPKKRALFALGGQETYEKLERIVAGAVRARFDLPAELHQFVSDADLRMLMTEAPTQLAWPPPREWDIGISPDGGTTIDAHGPAIAELMFLDAVITFAPERWSEEALRLRTLRAESPE